MVILLLSVYEFLSATGGLNSHGGTSAIMWLVTYLVVLIWSCVLAFAAPSFLTVFLSWCVRAVWGKEAGRDALNILDLIDLWIGGFAFIVPTLITAGILLLLGLFGFGDFAHGGYLFASDRSMNSFDWLLLCYIGFTNYSFFARFR